MKPRNCLWSLCILPFLLKAQTALADSVVVLNEIMYHPAEESQAEWIELANVMAVDVDISKWRLTAGVEYTFPEGTIIRAGGFMVVASDTSKLVSTNPAVPVLGPFQGKLDNNGERIELRNNSNRLMNQVRYGDNEPWPLAPDGSGVSLAKRAADLASDAPESWASSGVLSGTPGGANTIAALSALRFNETAPVGDGFWLELSNAGSDSIMLEGMTIGRADDAKTYAIAGNSLASGEFLLINGKDLGFAPIAAGDRLFLYSPKKAEVLDAAVATERGRARLGNDWLQPDEPTPGKSNAITLRDEIVINEIMYHAYPRKPDANSPVEESPEEWIELYNRADRAVDLNGWRLDEAISFTFPQGIILPAKSYIVVANDAAFLKTLHPGLSNVIGDFKGNLSNKSERVVLRDAKGNSADEVTYYGGGRWPQYADGGGSSLELRDPDADNSKPEAWAASDESKKAAWQTVRYRMESRQRFGLTTWNELCVSLLEAGEVHLDDMSIIQDPDGAKTERIQNGKFSLGSNGTETWRIIGNHRHSRTQPAPDDPANAVLHIVATGPSDTRHNHLETTLSENHRLVDGQPYEVSYRARWVAGSNQLNTRCYYAKLTKTTELEVPRNLGTPGQPNSRLEGNIGPTYEELTQEPLLPTPEQATTVSVVADDPDGLGQFTLRYSVDGQDFLGLPMQLADKRYSATIPKQAAASVVQFYVEGTDQIGAISSFPARGPNSRALYTVDDGRGSKLPVHELRLIMTAADRDFLLAPLNLMSNESLGCSVLYNRREIFHDVGVRMRGSGAGRARDGAQYQGFGISFHEDRLFRGVHGSVSIDRSGRTPVAGRQDEIYVKHMFNKAGIPCMYDDLAYFIAPRPQHTGTAQLLMARYGKTFTDSQYEDGGRGTIFNMDITYDPTSTVDGKKESLKKPVPFEHRGTDFTDLGDDKEQYRGVFEIQNGTRRDDYRGLMAFCKAMALPADQLATKVDSVMNVDEWMRCSAMVSLCGISDTLWTGGLQHNIRLYVPENGRVVGLPWDMDFVFNEPATAPMKRATGALGKVTNLPANTRLFYGHMHDLITNVFNRTYMDPWFRHYAAVSGQAMSNQGTYINARSNSVKTQLTRLVPEIPFEISTPPGKSSEREITLSGKGWINLREIRLAGKKEPIVTTWLTQDTWEIRLPVAIGDNRFTLETYDYQGALLTSKEFSWRREIPSYATYAGWRDAFFSVEERISDIATPMADANKDGRSNLLSYAFGQDPKQLGEGPSFRLNASGDLIYVRERGLADLTWETQQSSDLKNWTKATAAQVSVVATGSNKETVTLRLVKPQAFFRLAARLN